MQKEVTNLVRINSLPTAVCIFPAVVAYALQELSSLPLWVLSESGDAIIRSFVAKDFVAAMAFMSEVARISEEQGHHPDLHLTQYRHVEILLQTHQMGGGLGSIPYRISRRVRRYKPRSPEGPPGRWRRNRRTAGNDLGIETLMRNRTFYIIAVHKKVWGRDVGKSLAKIRKRDTRIYWFTEGSSISTGKASTLCCRRATIIIP